MDSNDKEKRNGKWQDLVGKCLEAYSKIEDSELRSKKLASIKESHRIYNMEEKITNFPWKDAYAIVQPFLTITVDNIEPRIVSSFTGREPYVQFDMTDVSEPDEVCSFLETWFNEELKETVGIDGIASRVTHDLLLEGTVFPIAQYEEDTVIREDFQFTEDGMIEVGDDGEPITVEVNDQIFQGGRVEFAEFKDIYIPDSCDDWEKTDIIRKVRPTFAELKVWEKEQTGYMNIGSWLLHEEEEDKKTNQQVVECLEYHVNYVYKKEGADKEDIADWTSERYVALIAKESEVLIRLLRLKELNFHNEHTVKRIRLYPEGGKAYGRSLYEKMRSIQNGASDTFNLLINSAFMAIIPWFLYSDKTGLPNDVEIVPGQGIKVDDPNSVTFPKVNIDTRGFIQVFDVWLQLWERLGSIGDLQVGKASQKADTATETMTVIQEGNIKHNYQATVMKAEFLALIKTIYDLYYKNMPFDTTFFYHGEEVMVSRHTMRRPLTFRLTGSTDLSNKVLELRKNEQLYNTLRQDPIVNPIELVENLIKSFKPDESPEKYINPEISQLIQQFLEQKKMEAEQAAKQQEVQGALGGAEQMAGGQQGLVA
jgi:hypothetical protein